MSAEITVVCCHFEPSSKLPAFSGCFDASWVDKLYRGVTRHLARFRFVCLVDHERPYGEPVEQVALRGDHGTAANWLYLMECFRPELADGMRMILGLDTIIVGPLDELAAYAGSVAVARDPFQPMTVCTGVILVSAEASSQIWDRWTHESADWSGRDIDWVRHRLPMKPDLLDDLYPGAVLSYKRHVLQHGLNGCARVVYFHGDPKPHALDDSVVRNHWT